MEETQLMTIRDERRHSAQERMKSEQFEQCEAIISVTARGRFTTESTSLHTLSHNGVFLSVLLRKEITMVQMLGNVFGKKLTPSSATKKVRAVLKELYPSEIFPAMSMALTEVIGWTVANVMSK